MKTKVCSKCGEEKPLDGFHKHKPSVGGVRGQCKSCRLEIERDRRDANRDEINARRRDHYQSNREAILAHHLSHSDYYARYAKDWRERNPDYVKQYSKEYRASDRGKAANEKSSQNYRARKLNLLGIVTVTTADLAKMQHNRCLYCGAQFSEDITPTVDHVIPLSRGGMHDDSNLIACCLSCNSSKGAKTPEEWIGLSVGVS